MKRQGEEKRRIDKEIDRYLIVNTQSTSDIYIYIIGQSTAEVISGRLNYRCIYLFIVVDETKKRKDKEKRRRHNVQ